MFSSFLDKLDTWVGRSFLIGAYLPFLIFGAANWLMAQFLFPDRLRLIINRLTTDLFGPLDATFAFLAVAAILAYMTQPFVRWMIGALRGEYLLPRFAKRWLFEEQRRKSRNLDLEYDEAGAANIKLEDNVERLRLRLRAAKAQGERLGTAEPMPRTPRGGWRERLKAWFASFREDPLVGQARRATMRLVKRRNGREPISADDLEKAVDALEPALRAYCSDETLILRGAALASRTEMGNVRTLQRCYYDLMEIIVYAKKLSEVEYTKALKNRDSEMSTVDMFPTTFGNKYAALANYFDRRFNLDLDFVLPILQVVVQSDANAAATLTKAQQQLEFSVRIFLFVIVFTAVWLPLSAMANGVWLLTLAVGTAGLIGAMITHSVVAASLDSYAENMRAVIVLKRFDILKALHMKIPDSWSEERAAWFEVNVQLQWNRRPSKQEANEPPQNVSYSHPSGAK